MKHGLVIILALLLAFPAFAVRIEHIEFIPKKILAANGHSADIAYHPNDGSVYCIWVEDGRLFCQSMSADGIWNEAVIISPESHDIYANEFSGADEWIRFSAGLTIDPDGGVHVVYSTRDGGVYYMDESNGIWNDPIMLHQAVRAMCHPEIAVFNDQITVIFEDAHSPDSKPVYAIDRINGEWEASAQVIMQADNPDLIYGCNGMVYIVARIFDAKDWDHNIVFGKHIPGFMDWQIKQITHSEYSIGKAPSLWAHNEKLYMAWSERLGSAAPTRDHKGPMYCATSWEPGNWWDLYLPSTDTDPLYSVATGDPYPRVSAFSDGVVFFTNGKRGWAIHAQIYAFVFDGYWTGNMECDWAEGIPHLASTGDIVWSIVSTSGPDSQEVSITGFRNTLTAPFDYQDQRPRIVRMPKTYWMIGQQGASACECVDADGDLLNYQLLQGPVGMTIDAQTGAIAWTPDSEDSFLLGIKVDDGRGKYDVRHQWIYGTHQLVEAGFQSTQQTGPAPLCVQFQNTTAGETDSVLWDFGDGDFSRDLNPTHCFSEPGNYAISLTAYRENQSDTQQKTDFISVGNPLLLPGFTVNQSGGPAPFEVQFQDTTLGNPDQWFWDFGDGNTSTDPHPTHVYTAPDTYTVTLTVTDAYQQQSVVRTDWIQVQYAQPVAAFSTSDSTGYAPLEIQFADISTGMITSWDWNFGDGTKSNLQHPVHTFNQPGIYDIQLHVSGPGGESVVKKSSAVHVRQIEPINVDFTADTLTGAAPLTVRFQDLSTGSITGWEWTFGDGISQEQHPVHTYEVPGQYTIMLTAIGPDSSASLVKYHFITVFSATSVQGETMAPNQYRLYANYPNPFNMRTAFRFDLPEISDVNLTLYDLRGKHIVTLLDASVPAGRHQIVWDGLIQSGIEAPSGVYIAKFRAGTHIEDRKVMLVK